VTDPDDLLLDALTPLGFRVRVTRQRWELITTAMHPVMAGREGVVRTALEGSRRNPPKPNRLASATLLERRGDETLDVPPARAAPNNRTTLWPAYPAVSTAHPHG
jgi:hypothetical protein